MLNADPFHPRPTLLHPSHIAIAVDQLGPQAGSSSEMWRLLTDHFTVDLDAVAALLPRSEPEPHWLRTRG
ncbi:MULTISPECIES: hypothetical protein [unclassified Methylobacterium]|uniref:hypothetical protein n=1 Tax=unclassified Methylobacterium TaxID=2615210 RepID=UPI0006F645A4|nr:MULTISPECIES: hypothetical protein [unclassified Methylobacterium]KQP88385.1 hypothetical protein ASF57_09430 [Methylobacterium sp. Leaf117]KQP94997.1 hypothetical protein ASF60_02110 [Methylobacterium sp. Leaf113]MCK2054478.1 hypothetical protein [Methylobacterium sp. 37f]